MRARKKTSYNFSEKIMASHRSGRGFRSRPTMVVTIPAYQQEWIRSRVAEGKAASLSSEVELAVGAWMLRVIDAESGQEGTQQAAGEVFEGGSDT